MFLDLKREGKNMYFDFTQKDGTKNNDKTGSFLFTCDNTT